MLGAVFRAGLCYFISAILLLSCRFHPEIFNIFYMLLCAAYGPLVMKFDKEGLYSAFISASLLPMFQYTFLGSLSYFIIQSFIQLIFIHTIYYHPMKDAVNYAVPEDFTLSLQRAIGVTFVINGAVVFIMHLALSRANRRILASELRKNELEKQKNFLLSFSHELRNLINSLTGNVKLAGLENNISIRVKEFLLNAEVCGELLLHLVNNILDTGKVEIGELEVDPRPTKVYDTLERIWSICSELVRRKGLKGKLEIQKNIPDTLMLDHYRLTQIFLNLVGNAIKFTEAGLIQVRVEWKPRLQEVTENCFQPYPYNYQDEQDEGLFEKRQRFSIFEDEYIVSDIYSRTINRASIKKADSTSIGILKVTVLDTGCGMSSQEAAQLFQKFTQVTSDASKKKLGTGLGLFISKQLCQKMNGEIRAFSKIERGSCFTFCLPLKVVEDHGDYETNIEVLRAKLRAKNLKAMLVDDIHSNHLVMNNFFERLEIEVVDIATNGIEAYEKYMKHVQENTQLNMLVMDLDMPIMNGKEASQKIRDFEKQKKLSECFLMIVSGNCTESEMRECLNREGQIRANSFVRKPVSIEDLERVIRYHYLERNE